MNGEPGTEGAGPGASARGVERVCVVVWDGSVPRAELRRSLGDVLPLHFVRWQDRSYLAAIEQLRPAVIVAVEPDDELAADVAGLLACLITSYTPTIVGMTLPPRPPGRRRSAARLSVPLRAGPPAGASTALGAESEQEPAVVGASAMGAAAETGSERTAIAAKARLLVRQLGPRDGARIDSLDDVIFC